MTPTPAAPRALWCLWALASLAAVGLHVAASVGVATARSAVLLAAIAGLLHLAVWRSNVASRFPRVVLVATAVSWGLLVVLPPVLSDDVWRYLLDGQTSCRGVSPFAYPPASPKVSDWVAMLPHPVNHPQLPTIYPPLAQGVFAAIACLGGGLVALKAVFALAWWAAAYAFSRIAAPSRGHEPRETSTGPGSAFLAAVSHPLPLLAIAGDGHVDAIGILLLALAVAGVARQRASWAVVGTAGAAAVKLFPLLLLFAGAAGQGWRRLGWAIAATMLLVMAWVPLAPDAKLAPGSAATFATTWVHQPALPSVVEPAVYSVLNLAKVPATVPIDAPDWVPPAVGNALFPERPTAHGLETTRWMDHGQWAALVTRLLVILLVAGVLWRTRKSSTRQAIGAVTTTLLLCIPVVHPWYVLWAWVPLATATSSDGVSRYLKQYVSAWAALAVLGWWGAASVADGGDWVDATLTLAIWHGLPALGVATAALWERYQRTTATKSQREMPEISRPGGSGL